jgi:thioredoxin-related protein
MVSHFSVAILMTFACLGQIAGPPLMPAQTSERSNVPVHRLDPARDARADIQAAVVEASRTGKRVLLDVGGNWCGYCEELDQLFEEHSDLKDLRDRYFITVTVNYSTEEKNQKALAAYPPIEGIPHFYVLDAQGNMLHSEHVADLRQPGRYSPEKMRQFLNTWGPQSTSSLALRQATVKSH